MEQGNRVLEIRKRFEGLNSRNNDSCITSKRQLTDDQIILQAAKKSSGTESLSNVKSAIKRSHAFRSDKKVKPFGLSPASFESQYFVNDKNSDIIRSLRIGQNLQSRNKVPLKTPNVLQGSIFAHSVASSNSINKVDALSDTLKKALKTPLPPGPAPRKPPRTFAHGGKTFDLEDLPERKLSFPSCRSQPQGSNENNVPHKHTLALVQRSKTEPHIMLKKLESALLINQVKNTVIVPKKESIEKPEPPKSNIRPTIASKTKTLCLSSLSCMNKNVYDTPFECANNVLVEQQKDKTISLPLNGSAYGRIHKNTESHIYDKPFTPRSERKFMDEPLRRSSVNKPSVHYMVGFLLFIFLLFNF